MRDGAERLGGNRIGYGAAMLLAAAAGLILLAMGRPPICTCGTIDLWHGAVDAGNSQHLSDWYSLSHIVHGLLFYAATWAVARRLPLGWRLALAVLVEGAWEIAENSPLIIERYRSATIALGYSGDSILNSMSDIAMMALGFLFAARAPVWLTVALGIALELLALWAIRDNLTVNILMLVRPIEAVKLWQAG